MMNPFFRWLFTKQKRWSHLRSVPFRQLSILLLGVFLLFTVLGFYTDLMIGGTLPIVDALVLAFVSGFNAMLWALAAARWPGIYFIPLIVAQFFIGTIDRAITGWIDGRFHPAVPDGRSGLQIASTFVLIAVVTSYICFIRFMGITGRDTMRIRNELELAHGIQKTLVPPITRTTAHFEIYGISHPSEKVGGDLVDVVELPGGDCVAYLADIAGHGLQAGILMGMLKTAARTALTDGHEKHSEMILTSLMERLNTVLPQVKEAHMYATFTALRLNSDGQAFYGMAASPPLLHWRAGQQRMEPIEEQQFPLGLLPVTGFHAHPLEMLSGDIAVIATDGILEVNAGPNHKFGRSKPGSSPTSPQAAEFGAYALASLIEANATMPLPELAAHILETVRRFGKQFDDQTLLLVRRKG